MAVTEHEIVLRWIASSVASRFVAASMERLAAWNMDMLARLSILEGAAGVSPGTWLRRKERGFGSALDHFGPKLAAAWTATTSQGVYDKAIAAAARNLRGAHGVDAYDVVQDLVAGSSSSSGPARNRIFYAVGKTLRKDEDALSAGTVTPGHRHVLGTIDNWVTRAARDVYKKLSVRHEIPFASQPGRGTRSWDPTRTRGQPELDDEERTNLLLLALQSPGGPGREVRRIIDQEVDRSFTPVNRPIVRMFLQKIGEPKYRSPQQMRRMLSRFNPKKWFVQALGLVRREIVKELGVSSQQIHSALGGQGRKVFKFMRERVGRNPRVRKIIEELADEIEILEPGVSRVAKGRRSELTEKQTPRMPYRVLRRWLEEKEKEREANLTSDNALASLGDHFEKDEYKNWDELAALHGEYSRGPSPLRVASAWMEGR